MPMIKYNIFSVLKVMIIFIILPLWWLLSANIHLHRLHIKWTSLVWIQYLLFKCHRLLLLSADFQLSDRVMIHCFFYIIVITWHKQRSIWKKIARTKYDISGIITLFKSSMTCIPHQNTKYNEYFESFWKYMYLYMIDIPVL